MAYSTVSGVISGKVAGATQVSGETARCTGRVFSDGQTGGATKGVSRAIGWPEKALSDGQTVPGIRASGQEELLKAREFFCSPKSNKSKASGKKNNSCMHNESSCQFLIVVC